MGGYEHVHQIQNGDKTTAWYIGLAGYTPPQAGSGHLDEGNYRFLVKGCELRQKKPGAKTQGATCCLSLESVEPQAQAGVRIVEFQNLPYDRDPASDKDYQRWQRILVSTLSSEGAAEQAVAGAQDGSFNAQWFENRYLYARVGDRRDRRNQSEVKYWITKSEFEAAPGPDRQIATSGPQMGTPELSSGGGLGVGSGTAPAASGGLGVGTAPAQAATPPGNSGQAAAARRVLGLPAA